MIAHILKQNDLIKLGQDQDQDQDQDAVKIDVRGAAIGNPWIDPPNQYDGKFKYTYKYKYKYKYQYHYIIISFYQYQTQLELPYLYMPRLSYDNMIIR